jgi:hypothetical protein
LTVISNEYSLESGSSSYSSVSTISTE